MDGSSSIASYLTTLTVKTMIFQCSEPCERCLQILKDRICNTLKGTKEK